MAALASPRSRRKSEMLMTCWFFNVAPPPGPTVSAPFECSPTVNRFGAHCRTVEWNTWREHIGVVPRAREKTGVWDCFGGTSSLRLQVESWKQDVSSKLWRYTKLHVVTAPKTLASKSVSSSSEIFCPTSVVYCKQLSRKIIKFSLNFILSRDGVTVDGFGFVIGFIDILT
jgi:hypothetical protein